mgnify:CR=1 FL=1
MIKIKIINILLIFFVVIGCREEDPVITKDESVSIRHTIAGYVQKGPFINGTSITIAELDDSLRATGRSFSTQINDNQGSFGIEDIELISSTFQLSANGFYFDEVKGEKSAAQLTLGALGSIRENDYTNINLLSHLTKDRILYLFQQGKTLTEAKQQAQREVLTIFGIEKEEIIDAELLAITQECEDHEILIAISKYRYRY